MTGPEHYALAEEFLAVAAERMNEQMSGRDDIDALMVAGLALLADVAQVHATLALVSITGDRVRNVPAWRESGAIG